MRIEDTTDRYLTWLTEVRNPSPHTIRAYTGDLRQWVEHVGGQRPVHDLPPECVHSFVLSQRQAGMSRRTISRRVATLRGLQKWLVGSQLSQPGHWDFSGLEPGRARALPRITAPSNIEQLHRHLRHSTTDVRDSPDAATTLLAVSFMLATGARVAETCALSVTNIDLGAGVVRPSGKGDARPDGLRHQRVAAPAGPLLRGRAKRSRGHARPTAVQPRQGPPEPGKRQTTPRSKCLHGRSPANVSKGKCCSSSGRSCSLSQSGQPVT